NYYVKEDELTETMSREYYNTLISVPQFVRVTETSFENQLCVYFEMQMATIHASADGIARIYNLALGQSSIPNASRLSHNLDGELVLDAFFLHAVLRDKSARQSVLSLPHHGPQRRRLDQVQQERNFRMVGTGQEFWAHACNRCMKIYQGTDSNWCISPSLYSLCFQLKNQPDNDSVTVCHLSCSVHNCPEALPTQKARRFCTTHNHFKMCATSTNATQSHSRDSNIQLLWSTIPPRPRTGSYALPVSSTSTPTAEEVSGLAGSLLQGCAVFDQNLDSPILSIEGPIVPAGIKSQFESYTT
ncbi:hypothetical protein C8F04DRAFT_966979, partial [Mycena alexandri]